MKTLELNEMELIQGGDWIDVIDGACSTVGIAGVFGLAVPGLNIATGACVGWGIGRGAGWIE